MNISYKLHDFEEARKLNLPYWYAWKEQSSWDDDYSWGIWRYEDDTPVEFIGDDRSEPEDALLIRSFSWVLDAIQSAYELGRLNRD